MEAAEAPVAACDPLLCTALVHPTTSSHRRRCLSGKPNTRHHILVAEMSFDKLFRFCFFSEAYMRLAGHVSV